MGAECAAVRMLMMSFLRTNKNVSDEEMYIVFTMAVGGVWPGSPNDDTPFPCSMVIDEITLYRAVEPQGGAL